jgi:hypothetical protein
MRCLQCNAQNLHRLLDYIMASNQFFFLFSFFFFLFAYSVKIVIFKHVHQASRLKNHLSSITPASSSRRMTDLVVAVHWGVNELAVVVIHLAHKDKY